MSETKRMPLTWNGVRSIGWADVEVHEDGTEQVLRYEITDDEIRQLLFPDLQVSVEIQPSLLDRPRWLP